MTIYQYGKLLIVLTAIHVVLPIEKILGMVDDLVDNLATLHSKREANHSAWFTELANNGF
jgi:hypothetical protein